MPELHELTIHELSQRLSSSEIGSEELTSSVFDVIEKCEKEVDAFLLLDKEAALSRAKKIDADRAGGSQLGRLAGIPYALKDILNTRGVVTTCASKMLENYSPIYDATAFRRLEEAGAVMVGKTNMDEFAMGSSTENSAYKKTKNPWDLERVPGGSSGGSAAAVASDMGIFALGTDTGGSIRQPAAFTGTVGLKPSYGLVSRYGLIAFASSLDQIGPMTKDVRDTAIVLSEIAGADPKDSTCLSQPAKDYALNLDADIKGKRIGIPKELTGEGISPDVREAFDEAIVRLEELGASVEETSLPNLEYSLSAYYLIAPAEASSNLARYDGVKYGYRSKSSGDIFQMYSNTRAEGFGAEVKRRIMLGTYALSAGYYEAYYGKANQVRSLIIRDFDRAFEKYDVLVSPTTPTTAFKLGEKTDDPLEMYLSDICTVPVNLAGLPAISIPCGISNNLPVGFQLIGNTLEEEKLLNIAYQLEKAIDFKHMKREEKKGRSLLEDIGWNLKLLSD